MNNYSSNQNLYNYGILDNMFKEKQGKSLNIYSPYEGFISGNMFPELYKGYKINGAIEISPMNEQAELLTYIDALTFAMIDLSLHLDMYPNDEKALEAFNNFNNQNKDYMRVYQEKYGPILMRDSNSKNYWEWSKSPWPWEND